MTEMFICTFEIVKTLEEFIGFILHEVMSMRKLGVDSGNPYIDQFVPPTYANVPIWKFVWEMSSQLCEKPGFRPAIGNISS